jgi:hypothetical protein
MRHHVSRSSVVFFVQKYGFRNGKTIHFRRCVNVSKGVAAPSSGSYIQGTNLPRVFNMKIETAGSPKYLLQISKIHGVASLMTIILLLTPASEIEFIPQNSETSNSAIVIRTQRDERRQ